MHQQNISLHQIASIATNELCDFIRLYLVGLKKLNVFFKDVFFYYGVAM
jgi:hypothetical protein